MYSRGIQLQFGYRLMILLFKYNIIVNYLIMYVLLLHVYDIFIMQVYALLSDYGHLRLWSKQYMHFITLF